MSGLLTVRDARADEVPAAVALAVQTAVAQRSPREISIGSAAGVAGRVREMYERALGPGGDGRMLVATAAGTAAGHLLLGLEVPPGRTQLEATVLDVWVAPAWRGHGVAGVLHQAALALAAQAGARQLKAMVALHNAASLQAHRKLGLRPDCYVAGKLL